MKISVIIVAGAQAGVNRGHVEIEPRCGVPRDPQSCDFGEWLMKYWWKSAVENFNFASNNWEEFTNYVKSVSRTDRFLNGK